MTHTCDGCRWAEWKRTANGRLHPDKTGKCKFPVKIPKLPAAFYWMGHSQPSGGYIERGHVLKEACVHLNRERTP